jgi:hypothetical protein
MLRKVHRLLIASAIVLGVLMVVFAVVRWAGGDATYVPTGIMGAVAAAAGGIYLSWFSKKYRDGG